MDQFRDAYDGPKFNWEDTNDLNIPVTSNEIETVKQIPNSSPGLGGLSAEFSKEERILMLYKSSLK